MLYCATEWNILINVHGSQGVCRAWKTCVCFIFKLEFAPRNVEDLGETKLTVSFRARRYKVPNREELILLS